jgi:mannose/cellobiose epimerase-like protein (N-acyl-D-glucosamine 2-epimerase family)
MKKIFLLAFILGFWQKSSAELDNIQTHLKMHLCRQVLPLWTSENLLDKDHGGALNILDKNCNPTGQKTKTLIANLRLLYVYAVAINLSDNQKGKKALQQRYFYLKKYLTQHFWNKESQSWRNQIAVNGSKLEGRDKSVISTIYACYIFSELALMLNDDKAEEWAAKSFQNLNQAWDKQLGGYQKDFTSSGHNIMKDASINFHALLMLSSYAKASNNRIAIKRLKKLYKIITNNFMDPDTGHGYMELTRDWKYPNDKRKAKSLYGHDIEMLWYIMDAADTLGYDKQKALHWLKKGSKAVMKKAITPDGAVKCLGDFYGNAIGDKIHFWCQAEAMILMMKMYQYTREPRYLEAFKRVKNWTFKHLVDNKSGLWRLMVNIKGKKQQGTFPGSEWRSGFHETRMLSTVIKLIKNMELPSDIYYKALSRIKAAEALQGVAVDKDFLYAVTSKAIGKYNKHTGSKVGLWKASCKDNIIHLDSGVIVNKMLYAGHSNFPGIPMKSSIEIWDANTLKHLKSIPLKNTNGSCTWIDCYDNAWWICYAHYAGVGGYKKIGPESTVLVKYDNKFNKVNSWKFPRQVVKRFYPYSCSGGSWGKDGLLYCSGHDRSELYLLKLPSSQQKELELVKILKVESGGQGLAWDRDETDILYTIKRTKKQIIKGKIESKNLN